MQTKAKTPDTARIPPHDIQTEQEILGGALWNHLACVYAVTSLSDDDFYPEAHQRIFRAIKSEFDKEPEGVNTASVAFELKRRETLEECGGIEYLDRLCGEYVTDVSHRLACKRLRELAALREAQKLGHSIFAEAEALPDDPLTFISEKLAALQALHEKALAVDGADYTTAEAAAEADGEETWLWHPWIPNGYITLIAGESGIGKSKLGLRIIESIVRPCKWPDGAPGPSEPGAVFHLDTEGTQKMQRARMIEAGFPMAQVKQPGRDGNKHLPLDDPRSLLEVRKACEDEGVVLLLIDSLRHGMRGDENSSEFGDRLQPWAELARDLDIAVVVIHHANKGNGDREMHTDRIRGSSAITALPRSIIVIDKPNEALEELRIRQIKNNLDVFAEPFGLRTTRAGVENAPVPHSPRQDFRAEEAEQWLRDLLRHGPVQSGIIRELADAEGIKQATLYRARDGIRVTQLPDPEDPRKRLWALAASPTDEGR